MTDSKDDAWALFATSLARHLSKQLTSSTFVLVHDEEGRTCAQFSGEPGADGWVVADVMDSTLPHGQEDWLSAEGRELMTQAGWEPHPEGGPFWQMEIKWSGDLDTCQIITDHTIIVLRDILRRVSPPPTIDSHVYFGYYADEVDHTDLAEE